MEEDISDSNDYRTPSLKITRPKHQVWLQTVFPGAMSFLLHTASLAVDTAVAVRIEWSLNLKATGLLTFVFIYVPVVFTFILSPPKLMSPLTLASLSAWIFTVLLNTLYYPIFISIRLLERLLRTLKALRNQKTPEEVLLQYETNFTKEIHTYLFLHAFLHCAPQVILQLHLILLGVSHNAATVSLQAVSIVVSLTTMAYCVASFHRYEAQVIGGRYSVLVLNSPEFQRDSTHDSSLLPISFCQRSRVISLQLDSPAGKVVAFFSWFCLITGRMLCLILGYETHPHITQVFVSVHFAFILLYLLFSESTTVFQLISRTLNAAVSVVALVEVSVRFFCMPLLYVLFFVCIFAEDTALLFLFFIYRTAQCNERSLDCMNFSLYAYLVVNFHVLGIVLFGTYLARYRPHRIHYSTSNSTSNATSVLKDLY